MLILSSADPTSVSSGPNPSVNGIPTGLPVFQSTYDTAGCCTTSPLAMITNFNVVNSGQNAIYNTERYSIEQFNNQLYGQNAVNGGMTDGLTSSLINSLGFEMNYFLLCKCSRMLQLKNLFQRVSKSLYNICLYP